MRGIPAVQFMAGRNRIGLTGSFLLLDVFLDDRQWCAAAGRREVRRGPQVTVHEVPADAAGELFPQVARRYALEPVDQRGDREFRGVADEQVNVVVFAVELAEFPPVPRDDDKVDVETADDAAAPADIMVWFPAWRNRYELTSD